MKDKKRERIIKISRIAAIIVAVVMIIGVLVQPFFR